MEEKFRGYRILLGSKSPRRRELMTDLRIPFTTVGLHGVDESYPEDMEADRIPEYLSSKKADHYLQRLTEGELLITADTLVISEGKVLGKPSDRNDAMKMLHSLSGKVHKVVTGVTLSTLNRKSSFSAETKVSFCRLSEGDIEYYVDNFRPFDKAGAYGIQEWIGCIGVDWIEGSFYNVMGLPVHRIWEELKTF